MEEKKKKKKLSRKIMLYCTCFAALLCLLIGGMGYFIFSNRIWNSNYTYANSVITSAQTLIDEDDWARCIENNVQSSNYKRVQEYFDSVKYELGLEYVYMIDFTDETDYNSARYVFIAYDKSELTDETQRVQMGDLCVGTEGGFEESILESFLEAYAAGQEDIQYIQNPIDEYGEWKTMLTAYRVLKDSKGENIGVFAVDIDITTIQRTLNRYLLIVAAGGLVILVLFLLIFLGVINRGVVQPIKQISDSTKDFVEQIQHVSHPSELKFREVSADTGDEIEELASSLNYMTREMRNYMINLKIVTEDKELLTQQVDIAKEIQLDMLPNMFPAFPGRHEFDLYSGIRTGIEGGGSFYDYFMIDRNHLGIVMGEVQGYGISTVLTSVIVSTHMRNYAQLGYQPARVMAETNNQLIGRNGEGRLGVHAFFARIDLANGRMSYASAGDIRPLLKHSYDEWKDCSEKNGMGLGIMKNVPFAVRQQSLVQGDLLCLYTPSVAGIENRKGEPLDNAGIMEEMERIIQQEFTLEGMYRKMQEKIEKFRAGKEQKPDSALVLFRYFGE